MKYEKRKRAYAPAHAHAEDLVALAVWDVSCPIMARINKVHKNAVKFFHCVFVLFS